MENVYRKDDEVHLLVSGRPPARPLLHPAPACGVPTVLPSSRPRKLHRACPLAAASPLQHIIPVPMPQVMAGSGERRSGLAGGVAGLEGRRAGQWAWRGCSRALLPCNNDKRAGELPDLCQLQGLPSSWAWQPDQLCSHVISCYVPLFLLGTVRSKTEAQIILACNSCHVPSPRTVVMDMAIPAVTLEADPAEDMRHVGDAPHAPSCFASALIFERRSAVAAGVRCAGASPCLLEGVSGLELGAAPCCRPAGIAHAREFTESIEVGACLTGYCTAPREGCARQGIH